MLLSPEPFYNWKQPRSVVDIRPATVFATGSFPGAISFPAEKFTGADNFFNALTQRHLADSVHVIDTDGSIVLQWPVNGGFVFLEGGYKALKNWRNSTFLTGPPIGIIAGKTGCGKTELLRSLSKTGCQIIDLELLAMHRGSVFGGFEEAQPCYEQFQFNLLECWLSLNPELPVWIEEKGHTLGRLGLPDTLYKRMTSSCLFELEIPFEKRLSHIKKEYTDMDKAGFARCIRMLEKRMGFSANHKALHYHATNQVEKCLRLLLQYYDGAYDNNRKLFFNVEIIKTDPHAFKDAATVRNMETIIQAAHKKKNPAVLPQGT